MSLTTPMGLTLLVLAAYYIIFVMVPTRKKLREELHVFLDLETYSTRPNAGIVAIGAVCRNLMNEEVGRIRVLVNLKDGMANGHVDPETVAWWDRQSDDAVRLSFDDGERFSLVDSLEAFSDWFDGLGYVSGVWGNGSTFDCVILRSAYTTVSGELPAGCPWDFWQERDVRTVVDLGRLANKPDFKNEVSFKGTRHNSVDDAAHQAAYTVAYIRDLI